MKPLKQKKCRECGKEFIPISSTAIVCSMGCAIEYSNKKHVKESVKKAKQERKNHRQALYKLKTRGYYVQQAQIAFNRFIRLRDDKLPCICCGKFRQGWDAGHYLARSIRPELRFNEDNCHKQAKYCNNYNKGNAAANYRNGLIARIGLERVLALEAPHPPAKWSIDDLKEIKRVYQEKIKRLNNV